MKNLLLILFFAVFNSALSFNGDFALRDDDKEELVSNFALVQKNVYRGAKIDNNEQSYEFLAKQGITTIINLRYYHKDDMQLCNKFRILCLHYPIKLTFIPGSDRKFDYAMLRQAYTQVIGLSEDPVSPETVFFHCKSGSDRTGALAAALYIRSQVCNGAYDKQNLKNEVKRTLKKHGFHKLFYKKLWKEILRWTQEPPEWICI